MPCLPALLACLACLLLYVKSDACVSYFGEEPRAAAANSTEMPLRHHISLSALHSFSAPSSSSAHPPSSSFPTLFPSTHPRLVSSKRQYPTLQLPHKRHLTAEQHYPNSTSKTATLHLCAYSQHTDGKPHYCPLHLDIVRLETLFCTGTLHLLA